MVPLAGGRITEGDSAAAEAWTAGALLLDDGLRVGAGQIFRDFCALAELFATLIRCTVSSNCWSYQEGSGASVNAMSRSFALVRARHARSTSSAAVNSDRKSRSMFPMANSANVGGELDCVAVDIVGVGFGGRGGGSSSRSGASLARSTVCGFKGSVQTYQRLSPVR